MIALQTFQAIWPLCVALGVFFALVSWAALCLSIPRLNCMLNSWRVFWSSLITWLIFMSIVMTLIDSPHLNLSKGAIDMLFMVSAFLGLPMSVPLLAVGLWALTYALRNERVPLASLVWVMLGTFGLGTAMSNVHDILWCGIITEGFTKHFAAGPDLVVFAFVGRLFGISDKVMYDYATLGLCAVLLVTGEMVVVWSCFLRLKKTYAKNIA